MSGDYIAEYSTISLQALLPLRAHLQARWSGRDPRRAHKKDMLRSGCAINPALFQLEIQQPWPHSLTNPRRRIRSNAKNSPSLSSQSAILNLQQKC